MTSVPLSFWTWAIGDLVRLTDDEWLVGIVSDHGGGPRPERLFVVNGWLREQGLLARPRQANLGLKRSALRLIRETGAEPAVLHIVAERVSSLKDTPADVIR